MAPQRSQTRGTALAKLGGAIQQGLGRRPERRSRFVIHPAASWNTHIMSRRDGTNRA
jgi:hypothetical protein